MLLLSSDGGIVTLDTVESLMTHPEDSQRRGAADKPLEPRFVSMSPDGHTVAALYATGHFVTWRAPDAHTTSARLQDPTGVRDFRLSNTGLALVSRLERLEVVSLKTGIRLASYAPDQGLARADISPDGTQVMLADKSGAIRLFSLETPPVCETGP